MKTVLVKLGFVLFLIGISMFSCTKKDGPDWKYYGETDLGIYFYNTDSILRPSKGIVRVWEKEIYTERGINEMVRNNGNKFNTLGYVIFLSEYNCIEKKCRTCHVAFYSKDGTVIVYFDVKEVDWRFIVPGSVDEGLYKRICK